MLRVMFSLMFFVFCVAIVSSCRTQATIAKSPRADRSKRNIDVALNKIDVK